MAMQHLCHAGTGAIPVGDEAWPRRLCITEAGARLMHAEDLASEAHPVSSIRQVSAARPTVGRTNPDFIRVQSKAASETHATDAPGGSKRKSCAALRTTSDQGGHTREMYATA
jgi:hypothetical protein